MLPMKVANSMAPSMKSVSDWGVLLPPVICRKMSAGEGGEGEGEENLPVWLEFHGDELSVI